MLNRAAYIWCPSWTTTLPSTTEPPGLEMVTLHSPPLGAYAGTSTDGRGWTSVDLSTAACLTHVADERQARKPNSTAAPPSTINTMVVVWSKVQKPLLAASIPTSVDPPR